MGSVVISFPSERSKDLLSRFDRRIPSAFGSAMQWLHTGPRQCHEEEEEPSDTLTVRCSRIDTVSILAPFHSSRTDFTKIPLINCL